MWRVAGLALGLGLIAAGATVTVNDARATEQEEQRAAARLDPSPFATVDEVMKLTALHGVETESTSTRKPAPGMRIGRLEIPRIGLDEVVVEGIDDRRLAVALGRFRRTAMPGDPGATAIVGHRTGWGSPLLHLDRAVVGTRMRLTTPSERLSYVVTRKLVVEPEETWVLAGLRGRPRINQLVIVTCTPPHSTKHRLVVFADLVERVPD